MVYIYVGLCVSSLVLVFVCSLLSFLSIPSTFQNLFGAPPPVSKNWTHETISAQFWDVLSPKMWGPVYDS
jgi:hypothetical protein